MKKRICFISPFAYPLLCGHGSGAGGAERQFYLFGRYLAKEGWKISFITHTPPAHLASLATEFQVYPVNFGYLGGSKIFLPTAFLGLWRAMYKSDADYYVLKVPTHLLAVMAVFCKVFKRRLVFWGQTTYATKEQRKHIPTLVQMMETYGMRQADILIAQTNDQAKSLKDATGHSAYVIRNIAASIQNVIKENSDTMSKSLQCDVLWAGNSTPNKRPGVVMELARMLPDVSFAMGMNKSSSSAFEHWEKMAEPIQNLRFLGELSPGEMEHWFTRTRLLLNTSEREGFPNTFLQAWLNNVPVVSLEIDPDQIIREYGLGRIHNTNELEQAKNNDLMLATSMVSSIRELLQNEELRKEIGLRAAQYLRKYHSPAATIPSLMKRLSLNNN